MSKKKSFLSLISLILTIWPICLFTPTNLEAYIYGSICGKVIAGDTGKPLAKSQIILYYHHPEYGLLDSTSSTFTDKEGNFCFEILKEGIYYLTYETPHPYLGNSGLFTEEYFLKNNLKSWPGKIVLEKGRNINITFTANQIGGSISGRVLKGDGVTPFPDVQIIVFSSEVGSAFVNSKDNGNFRCTHLIPADNYEIQARFQGYGEKIVTGIKVEANKESSGIDIIIDIDDPTGVEGTVISPDGNPILLATVTIKNELGFGFDNIYKDGKYSISGIKPGIYTLKIATSNSNGKLQIKEINRIFIEKGKKTKVDVTFDSYVENKSYCSQSLSNQIKSSFLNSENSLNNSELISSDSSIKWDFPEIIIIPEYYDVPGKREFVTAYSAILYAWFVAAEKIVSDCGKWDEGDRKCARMAAEKAILSRPKIVLYPYTELWGRYGYDKYVNEKAIQIMGYDRGNPYCKLFNLMLHEILHRGGLPGGEDEDEQRVEACANLCFQGEEEKCRWDAYGSKLEDCDCKDLDEDGEEPPGAELPPSGDTPDDNFSVASSLNSSIIYESHNPDLLILRNGYHREAGALINKLKRGFSYIEPDQSPSEMKEPPPILLIPTGGLNGLENSEQFKNILDEYVRNGGTVICFSQQRAYEFSVLPTPDGEPLLAYGWREDQSCWTDALYIDSWHPVVSSAVNTTIPAEVDGYFTLYPENTTTLIKRTKNGEPAMMSYPYGEGLVVVTSMYEDWRSSHWQSTTYGRAIVRDLISWAKNPDLIIQEYNLRENLNPMVSLNLKIRNLSYKTASKTRILWLDADRNTVFEEEKIVSIPSEKEITISVNHTFSEILITKFGIWHVDYILFDSEGNEIQSQTETDSGRFIICKPPQIIYEIPDITCNITTADELILKGTKANFQVHFTNHSDQDNNVSLYWDWTHGARFHWDEVVIPANSSLTKGIAVDLPQNPRDNQRFWVWVLGEDGRTITNASKGIRIITPSIATNLQTDKTYYRKGETVNIDLSFNNLENLSYDSVINLRVVSPINQIIYSDSFNQQFEANEMVKLSRSFIIPSDVLFGSYLIYLEALESNQGKIGGSSSIFEIPVFKIKTEIEFPLIFQPNSSNTFSFVLTNTGKVEILDGNMHVKFSDPEDQLIFQEQQTFSLPLAQSTTLNFTIPLSDIKFGDYKLIYNFSDAFGVQKPIQELIPSAINLDLNFNKNFYRVRDNMNLSLNLTNSGKFLEELNATINIPSFQYSESKPITLNPNQTGNLSYSTTIPIIISSGLQSVEVALTLPSGNQQKKTFTFAIPGPNLLATFDAQKDFSSGEDLNFQIFNSGGIDSPFEYQVNLTDLKTGEAIYTASSNGVIQAGSTIALYFTIPLQAVNSEYLVKVELKDFLGKKTNFYKNINITGLGANLEVKTDQDIYLNTENISALSKVINTDKEITDGKLHLQIVSKEPSLKNEWTFHYNPFDRCRTVGCDKNNNIWISGYYHHIAKYDGTNWRLSSNEIEQLSPLSHPDSNFGHLVITDRENNIWICRDSGTPAQRWTCKFDGTSWTTYNSTNSGLISDIVWDVEIDLAGNTWFATEIGAIKFDGTNWTTINTSNSGLVADNVRAIAVDLNGNLWFASGRGFNWFGGVEKGVSKFDGTNWTTYDTSNSGIASNAIGDIAADPDGNVWFSMLESYKGVSKFDGANWKTYDASNSGLNTRYVYFIEIDNKGNIWLATGDTKVVKYDGTRWITYDQSNSCIDENVWNIISDKNGNIWCAAHWADGAVYHFDGTIWTKYKPENTGMQAGNYLNSLIQDTNGNIWAGTEYYGASRFNGESWTTYNTSNSGIASNRIYPIIEDSQGHFWFGTWGGGVSKFDGTNWTTYNTSNSGLTYDNVRSIVEDLKGNLWFGTWGGGVSKFDGTNWTTYNTTNSGLPYDRVSSIEEDLDENLWFGSFSGGGISKFDGLNWTTYNTSNSGLANDRIYSIVVDQSGNLWFGTYGGGVSKFNGTNWTTYNQGNSGLGGNYVSLAYIDSKGNLWFGHRDQDYNYRVSKFDCTNWTIYSGSDSGFQDSYVYDITEDKYGNLWFSLSGIGIVVLKEKKKVSSDTEPVWETEISLNLSTNQTQDINTEIGTLDYTGKLYLQGKLLSSTGQIISEAEYPFYITKSDTVLMYSTDKIIYSPGDTVSIQGEVKNMATIELSNVTLKIEKLSLEEGTTPEEVYNENFTIPAQGTHVFNFTISASGQGSFTLTGIMTQNDQEIAKASDQYDVSSPDISATIIAPEVVGLNPFEINIELKNTGLIDGTVIVDIQPVAFSQEITVPTGETKRITSTQQIIQTTVFNINFTGDYTALITKNVIYGLGAQVSITPPKTYPEGRVEIPVKVTNTGILENEVIINFTLKSNSTPISQLTKSYYLPINQFKEDTLVFNLNPGNYTLSWSSAYGTAQMDFLVKPLEQMLMTAELGVQAQGIFPLNINLINNGYFDFSGNISVESAIYSSLQEVTLSSGSSSASTFSINPQVIADGQYNLSVKLLRLDNTEVLVQTVPIIITKPKFELISIPTGKSFSIGEDASFPFTVKNTGSQEGKANLNVEVMDVESAEVFYLSSGQQEELSYTYFIADDLPEGSYNGKYTLIQEGVLLPTEGEFIFNVEGIDIDVEAQLDKDSYKEGETAQLTLNITNKKQTSFELFSKVSYLDHEAEQSFTLNATSSLTFNIPLPEITEEKVFYGIYHRDGRGIHLNDIYIYKKGEVVEVVTDKQVYNLGETVQIAITTTKPGLMRIEAPNYEEEFTVEGSTSRAFVVPSDLIGGTYGVSWEFKPTDETEILSGVNRFDVAGVKVVITEASLDKSRYLPGDTIQTRIVLESNHDISAIAKYWIMDPEGDYTGPSSAQISLSAQEHTVAQQSLTFETTHAGIHKVVYGFYTSDKKLLVSGSEAFDCGGAVVLGLSTEKRDYPLGTEEVKTSITLFGEGEAELTLLMNETPVKTLTVSLSGVTTEEIIIQQELLKPGSLILRAEVKKDNLLSQKQTDFNYGTDLPDLTVSMKGSEKDGLNYTYQLEVLNAGKQSSGATTLVFKDNDVDVEIVSIPVIEGGKSFEFTINWSGIGKAGSHEFVFEVDHTNSVREFSENNNQLSFTQDVQIIFYTLKVDPVIWPANSEITIISKLINNQDSLVSLTLNMAIINNSSGEVIFERVKVEELAAFENRTVSDMFNTSVYPAGEYTISQYLIGKNVDMEEEISVIIEETKAISATLEIMPPTVPAGTDTNVAVTMNLENTGNVVLEDEILIIEIFNKDTEEIVKTEEHLFSIQLAEQKEEKRNIILNLVEGNYEVRLTYLVEIVAIADLIASGGIEKEKEISIKPRVLIMNLHVWGKHSQDLKFLSHLLQSQAIEYETGNKTVNSYIKFHKCQANVNIVLGSNMGHKFRDELKERVWRGEALIIIFDRPISSRHWVDFLGVQVSPAAKKGMKGKSKKKGEKQIELLASELSLPGEFELLEKNILKIIRVKEDVSIIAQTKFKKYPVISFRKYGNGHILVIAVPLKFKSGIGEVSQMLLNSVNLFSKDVYTKSDLTRLLPVEISIKNETGDEKELMVKEILPYGVEHFDYQPDPEEGEELKWKLMIPLASEVSISYWLKLPDQIDTYDIKTEIYEGETKLDEVSLSLDVSQTVQSRIVELILEIEAMEASGKDVKLLRKAKTHLVFIMKRTGESIIQLLMNLFDSVRAAVYLGSVKNVDVSAQLTRTQNIMIIMGRRLYERVKQLGKTQLLPFFKMIGE